MPDSNNDNNNNNKPQLLAVLITEAPFVSISTISSITENR